MAFGAAGLSGGSSTDSFGSNRINNNQQAIGLNDDPVQSNAEFNKEGFDFGGFGEVATSVGLDVTQGQPQQEGVQQGQVGFTGLGNELQRSNILGLNFKGLKKAPVPLQALFSPAAAINNLLGRREKRFQKEIDGYNNELNAIYDKQEAQDELFLSDMHDSALKSYNLAEGQNKFMNNFYNAARQIKKANKNNQDFISKQSQQITESENKAVEDINKVRRQGL